MHACQTDAYFSQIIGSGLRSPVVRHSGSRSHRVASAGPRPSPSRQLSKLARDISVCFLFWTVFSRTGAEKLLGLSEPAPQIPDRALRHFWLWFDPSALGVNVDRTQDTRAFLTVKLPHFYHTSTAPTSPRTRVPPLRARPAGTAGMFFEWRRISPAFPLRVKGEPCVR